MKKNFLPWIVLALLFLATGLSFLDRQVLSVTIIKIQSEFKFSDVEYGFVVKLVLAMLDSLISSSNPSNLACGLPYSRPP